MWELTKSFRFEAAHALSGTTFGAASEEIHGHSFRTEVTVRGTPDPATGMVLDLGLLERSMAEVQKTLDHKLLNKVEALGLPTLENLSRFIGGRAEHAGKVTRVSVTATAATKAARITGRKARCSTWTCPSSTTARHGRGAGSRRCATTSCSLRAARRRRAGLTLSGPRGAFRAHAMAAHRPHRRARRRWRNVDDARPAVREGRRALLYGARRVRV